jgi:SAM-dependent methyltransferase
MKAGYYAIGLDISHTAVRQAKENFGDYYICTNLFEYAELNPESFDIVILTEVIEHIDKPIDFIASIIKLLRPNGRAIITTPNKSLFPIDIIWATELPPVHCWWLSEESMKCIANKLNVKLSFINYYNYYKKNYLAINLKTTREMPYQKPFFNRNGELLIQPNKIRTQNSIGLNFRSLIAKIPYIKKIYRKMTIIINPETIICKEKGIVLCTIFQK